MQLIFATNNAHKVSEINHILGNRYRVISLKEAGIIQEIPEPHDSLEENAREKSTTIYRLTGNNCFSEDTGLFVPALNMEPGVRSARYAGEQANAADNMQLLLRRLTGAGDRSAFFKTIISLIINGEEFQFTGICPGHILESPSGSNGFGYDPVFVPDGGSTCFGQMNQAEKSAFSHRKKAVESLVQFLNQHVPDY